MHMAKEEARNQEQEQKLNFLSPLEEAQVCLETGACFHHPTETCEQCGTTVCDRHIREIQTEPDHSARLCFGCFKEAGFFDESGNWLAK
jgi:hypothetical protein